MTAGGNGGSEADALRREAIAWVVRLTSGDATADDAARLKAWRARSDAHEQAFRLAGATWRQVGSAAASNAPARPSRRLFLVGAGAGTALAAGWAGVSLGLLPGLDQLMADHATAIGEQAHIALPDGSAVDLDSASALDVRITDTLRGVRLVSGAAAFDVARDPRPFRATVGPGEVTTGDGAFAVTAGSDQSLVDCTRGVVEVACNGTVRLKAGERVSLDAAGASAPERVDPATTAPWRRGLLVFSNRPLVDVVADINRHRRGRIVLARPGLGARRVDGVFHLDRPDEIVTHLAAALQLSETRLPAGVVLLA